MTRRVKAMKQKRTVALICMTLAMLGEIGCGGKAKSGLRPRTKTAAEAQAEAERRIKVPLPTKDGQATEDIVIEVKADGTYVVGEMSYDLEAIEGVIKEMAENPEIKHVIVTADRGIEFKAAVELLDLCKKHGLSNISFAVRREEAAEAGGP